MARFVGQDASVNACLVAAHDVLQGASRVEVELDGYLKYRFVTTAPGDVDGPRVRLEAGIIRPA
jgi:hypothetical protein